MTDYRVRLADWTHDLPALREVRTRVFIDEQRVPESLEWDAVDEHCVHALALAGDRPVGTGRLTPDAHIGRMAVLREWRGRGVGSRLLEMLLAAARRRGDRIARLNAQTHAVSFYARYGFTSAGEEFLEADIPHIGMQLDLANPPPPARLSGRRSLAAGLTDLARSARTEFALYSAELASDLTDRPLLAETLRALAIDSPRARIRLLCRDARPAAQAGHPLLKLAAALPSRCAVRRLATEDEAPEEMFAFADLSGGLLQPRADNPEAVISLAAPRFARGLADRFEPLWERGTPDPEARRLHL